jgi:hypothetical protein
MVMGTSTYQSEFSITLVELRAQYDRDCGGVGNDVRVKLRVRLGILL